MTAPSLSSWGPATGDNRRRGDSRIKNPSINDLEIKELVKLSLITHELLISFSELFRLFIFSDIELHVKHPLLRGVDGSKVIPRWQVRDGPVRRLR